MQHLLATGRDAPALHHGTRVSPFSADFRQSGWTITRRQVIKHLLSDLKTGDTATIVGIGTDTPLSLRRRLLDMGITKGAELRVERHAPLGDPVEIFVKGYYLAVRMSEARTIEVELVNHASAPLVGASENAPK
jgi:ferrous iron transport protein A